MTSHSIRLPRHYIRIRQTTEHSCPLHMTFVAIQVECSIKKHLCRH